MNLFNKHRLKQLLIHNIIYGENERAQNRHYHQQAMAKTRDMRMLTLTWAVPDPARVWGVDVSGRWDGNVNFAVTKAAGASFAIIKCMDGAVATRYWAENYQRSLDAGLITGSYGWLYPNKYVDCKAQARAQFEKVRTVKKQLPLTIDFEWTQFAGQAANPNFTDLDIWVTEFIRLSGYKPILYTAAGYCNLFGKMPAELRNKFSALWIANYGVLVPMLPAGWSNWQLHQFAGSGEAAKVAPNDSGKLETDLNYWIDDLEALQKFAGVTVTPPTNGEPMPINLIIRGDVLGDLHIRAGAGTDHQIVGVLHKGDKIEASENTYQWLHLSSVNNYPVVGQWASAGSMKQYIAWDWFQVDEPPPPANDSPPDYIMAHWIATNKTTKYIPE